MDPFVVEVTLHWIAVAIYIVAAVLFAYSIVFDHKDKISWGLWATAVGLVPHSAAILVRWVAVGHGPYMLKYEVLSSNAWIGLVMLLVFVWPRKNWAPIALLALPAAILVMGFGLFSNPEAINLPPTLRSVWLVFHVVFNKLSVGAFILSAASAIVLLLKDRKVKARWLDILPEPDVIEANMVRLIGFGFMFWSTTIVAGAIWANQTWGRYWGWDRIETWSLVTWLSYGILLHARIFFKLKLRGTAWGTLACFVVSVLTIFIFPFLIPSLHSVYFQ